MKMNLEFNKKRLYQGLSLLILAVCVLACVSIASVDYENTYKAGETATFTVDVKVDPSASESNTRLIVGMLVPKSWKAAANTTVTYTSSIPGEGVVSMKLIPASSQPEGRAGMTWPQALRETYGFAGNVLDDMEWVAWQSDAVYSVVKNENLTAKVKFVTKIGPENMRVKLAFYTGHSKNGLKDSNHSAMKATDCIDIIEGKGEIVDFCEPHFNMVQPSYVSKDDILTFKFQGDIGSNDLDNAKEIYFYSVAHTNAGKEYPVTGRTAESKMKRELDYGRTYSLTFWPADYYGIPDNETIIGVSYFFTNEDGTLWVKNNANEPFIRQFTCGDE